jgi:DNA-binding NtrC family response regulator
MEKILVIDDEPIIRESMAAYLEDSGFHVCQAEDGAQGLDVFRREKPDLIMVDLRMPGVDGLEVLAAVLRESPDTPTLVVSGTGVIQDAIEALKMGAMDFVTKPILDMAVLEHAAGKALERARLRVENRRYREHLETEVCSRTAELVERTHALQESEARLSAIIEIFEGLIYTINQDHRIEFMNRKLMDHIGRDATGDTCYAALYNLGSPCPWCVNDRAFQGETIRWETRSPRDGRWYYSINTPLFGTEGQVLKVQSIALDITERKEAEESLREQEVRLREENIRLRSSLKGSGQFGRMIGRSAAMQRIYETILKAAQVEAGVIIYGESGTGKELAAQTIHELSRRSAGPFITVNCGAIPDTLIESEFFGYKKGAFTGAAVDKPGFLDLAHGGTLFLDEVGEIPLNLQVKLLRAIEGGGYTPVGGKHMEASDFRIIAATHRNLRELVEQQKMRQDFFYRIHLIPIYIAPLRQRKEDLPQLIDHFLNTLSDGRPLPDKVVQELLRYDWPGNVRELQNVIHCYVTLGELELSLTSDPPEPADTPSAIPKSSDSTVASLAEALNEAEKSCILQCLQAQKWKRGRVAEILGIDRRTLFRKMKHHGLL